MIFDKNIKREFLGNWMHDVGRYELPDLANFRPKWEEAQKLGIQTYDEYKKYKRKEFLSNRKSDTSSSQDYIGENKESNNNNDKIEMLPKVQKFISKYEKLINDENWDALFIDYAEEELNLEEQSNLIEILQSIGCDFEVIE